MADLLRGFGAWQWAGFKVTTSGPGNLKNDNTDALVPSVSIVDPAAPTVPLGTAAAPLVTSGTSTPATSTTGTESTVASSATSVALLALNTSRKGYSVFNASTQILYLRQSATAATASSGGYTVQIAAGGYWESPFNYTGAVTGIWASANGAASITEYT